jgi:hypothetical protein
VVLGGYFATLARMRRPYPTDLSDAEWNHIAPHLPAPEGHGRPRAGWEKGAAREKTWKGSQGEGEALRKDPFRSFTGIDPSSKPGVTHPKESGPARSEGRAR